MKRIKGQFNEAIVYTDNIEEKAYEQIRELCNHGCIYCDSRSDSYQNDNFDEITVKENTLELLRNELKRKREKGIIGLGSMSDSYNLFEKELQITQKALETL